MDVKGQVRLEFGAALFKALAHPTRLLVIEQLAREEHCVNELTELAGVDMSTVSRHLSVLKNAGVIQDEKRGNQVFYRLAMPCVLEFLKCAEKAREATAKRNAALLGA